MALNKPKHRESLVCATFLWHPWVQPFGEGVEEDTGCTLLLPGEVSRNAASCTQPCPFNTKGRVCLWVLLGQLWDTPVWGGGVTLYSCVEGPCFSWCEPLEVCLLHSPSKGKSCISSPPAPAQGHWSGDLGGHVLRGNPEERTRGSRGRGGDGVLKVGTLSLCTPPCVVAGARTWGPLALGCEELPA